MLYSGLNQENRNHCKYLNGRNFIEGNIEMGNRTTEKEQGTVSHTRKWEDPAGSW